MEEKQIPQAANDTIIVVVPIIKETTESGLFKGEQVTKEEVQRGRNEIYVVSVGALVQDKNIEVGDQILVNGQVTMLPSETLPCPLVGFEYASVKGYHVSVIVSKGNEV